MATGLATLWQKMPRLTRRRAPAVTFGLIIVVLLTALRLADPYPVVALRNMAFDTYQRLWRPTATDLPIRIVAIDEASLPRFGQWPWPRDRLAELTNRLTAMGAAAIAFDMLFPEPSRPTDKAGDPDKTFAAALAAAPSILGFAGIPGKGPVPESAKAGFAVTGGDPAGFVPVLTNTVTSLPVLTDAAAGLGSLTLEPSGSVDVVRQLPLLWSNGRNLFPTLSLEALRLALGAGTIVVAAGKDGDVLNVRLGDIDIPTTSSGALKLAYPRLPDGLFVSASDVLDDTPTLDPSRIAGHVVFVGTTATGLSDIKGTPLGTDMAGVELHALALAQMLEGTFLQRSDWISGLEILAFFLIGIAIVLIILRSGPFVSLFVGLGAATAILATSMLAYTRAGFEIDPSFPLLGSFVVYSAMLFFQYLITDADKRRVRAAFGHYVSPELLTRIEKSDTALQLGGETRDLTVMFSDIRGFTPLSEGLEPSRLVFVLNTLFSALGIEITRRSGTIDKFIGDAIMAFWNAPVDVPDHAARAVEAALGMRTALRDLNRRDGFGLRKSGHAVGSIEIGIGIATGPALVGNLGLQTRFDYSCVGNTVNTASRVEGASKTTGYDIVATEAVRRAAPDFAWLAAGSIALKGKAEREDIYILVGDRDLAESPAFAALVSAHSRLLDALGDAEAAEAALEACLKVVPDVDERLKSFYEKLVGRHEDFFETS